MNIIDNLKNLLAQHKLLYNVQNKSKILVFRVKTLKIKAYKL